MDNKLKLVIKVAAILLTAPATIEVAGAVYPDNIVYRIMVQAAALVLVEGALMLGWHKLDTDAKATMPQRWLYAAIAVVAYIVLWAVAIAHHEGGGAWFRATLGVLLGYSIIESGILANIKLNTDTRDIMRDIWVIMHARKLDRKEAKAQRTAMNAVRMAFLNARQDAGVHAAGLFAEQLKAENEATHEPQMVVSHEPSHKPPREWDTWIFDAKTEAKADAKALVAELLQDDPDISNYRLAKLVGRSDATIRKYRKELAESNGHHEQPPDIRFRYERG